MHGKTTIKKIVYFMAEYSTNVHLLQDENLSFLGANPNEMCLRMLPVGLFHILLTAERQDRF
jgi:hypothetical protein